MFLCVLAVVAPSVPTNFLLQQGDGLAALPMWDYSMQNMTPHVLRFMILIPKNYSIYVSTDNWRVSLILSKMTMFDQISQIQQLDSIIFLCRS